MSFDFSVGQILQYSTNIFSSVSPLIYLFGGAALAIFIFTKIVGFFRKG